MLTALTRLCIRELLVIETSEQRSDGFDVAIAYSPAPVALQVFDAPTESACGIREHIQRDDALRERLRPILVKLQNLLALVERSYKLAGADLMKNGTAVYQILRLNGYQEGLEPLLEELGTRFARPGKKKVPTPDTPAPAAMAVAPIHEAPSHAVPQRSVAPVQPTPPSGEPVAAEKNPRIEHHRQPEAKTRILPPFTGRRFRPLPKGGRSPDGIH